MDWIERLNLSIDYIEAHLTDDVDYDAAAKVALCSSYHFQRMFSYMSDMTLAEYIRRRRMSRAAADLMNGEKVLDVALKYGYDSPTAFNRAFRSVHGVAPSALKKGVSVRTFTPIRFKLTIKGAEEMDFKLVKKDAFRVVGIVKDIYRDIEKNFAVVPPMWENAQKDGTLERLCGLMNAEPQAILGMSICDPKQWRYAIGVASTAAVDAPLTEIAVPAATWAVFYGEGTNRSIQELEKRIHAEWVPTSGYDYDDKPEIEVYYNADPENAKFEVWLPVVPKK